MLHSFCGELHIGQFTRSLLWLSNVAVVLDFLDMRSFQTDME